jgi:hypothetical protein
LWYLAVEHGAGNTNTEHADRKLNACLVSAASNLTTSIFSIAHLAALLVTASGDNAVDCHQEELTPQVVHWFNDEHSVAISLCTRISIFFTLAGLTVRVPLR